MHTHMPAGPPGLSFGTFLHADRALPDGACCCGFRTPLVSMYCLAPSSGCKRAAPESSIWLRAARITSEHALLRNCNGPDWLWSYQFVNRPLIHGICGCRPKLCIDCESPTIDSALRGSSTLTETSDCCGNLSIIPCNPTSTAADGPPHGFSQQRRIRRLPALRPD